MCVLCSLGLKISGHSPEVLRVDAEVLGETVSEKIGPSPLDFRGVDESDIKAIAPQSSDVTIGGESYQRSWYMNPATDLQKPITITYGFASQESINTTGARANTILHNNENHGSNGLAFTAVQKNSTREIFSAISKYTNITFEEVNSGENILLFSSKLTNNVAGLATLPTYGTQKSGFVIINNTDNTTGATLGDSEYKRGSALFSTIIHEIGHALGLKHPHDPDSNNFKFDNGDMRLSATNSVMSYKELAVMRYVESFADGTASISQRHAKSFQHLDVLALQSVYGIGAGRGHTEVNLKALWDEDRDNGGMQEVVSDLGGKDMVIGHSSRPNLINLQSGSVSNIGYGHSLWLGAANGVNLGVPLGIVSKDLPIDADLLERIYKGKYNLILAANSIFENAKGGSADDELLGNHYNNELSGLDGNDKLHGFEGDDKLIGGNGNDVLDGGKGSDTLDGGSGQDIASFATSVAGVYVSLLSKTATTENGKDTLTNIEGVIGSDYNDTIIGDNNANVLVGGRGHDVIHGGGGDDTLDGSADSIGIAFGGQMNNLQRLLPPTAKSSDNFGANIVVEGNVLIIGDADAHGGEGRVYVFVRSNSEWVYKQTLSNNSLAKFGKSLAIEDGLLVVGSERAVTVNSSPKVEYAFYHLSASQEFSSITYDTTSTGGGEQVSISRNASHTGTGQGFFFVHKVSEPGEEAKIYIQFLKFENGTVSSTSDSGSTTYRNFSLSDNLLLYGASQTAATVYDLTTDIQTSISGFISPHGWDSNLKNLATLSQSAIEMGRAFATYNDILATSAMKTKAPTEKTSQHWETASGLIQVFRKKDGKWIQEALIFDTSVTANDKFGASIALTEIDSSELMAVGAPDGGKVYIYRYEGESGWVLKITISKPQNSTTGFGKKLAFASDGTLIISTDNGIYSYVYEKWAPFHEKESDNAGDRLFGGDGNDTLINTEKSSDIFDGGSGVDDTVIFHGYRSDYTITRHNDGFVVVTKGNAIDNLYSIEKLIFWDQELNTRDITDSTADTTPPTITLGSAEGSSSTIQIAIKSNEKGLLYALVVKEEVELSQEDVKIQGQHVKVESNNSYYTFKFNDLSPATNYKIYIVAEDNAGNTDGGTASFKTTSTAFSKAPVTTLVAGDNVLEVKFALTSQAKVYYAYYNTENPTPPTVSELKDQQSDAFQHGIAWVEKAYQEQVIHIISVKEHTTKKLYIHFDGSDKVFEIDTPQSQENTGIIGLATDHHYSLSNSDWI